jgi:hypothetical protein
MLLEGKMLSTRGRPLEVQVCICKDWHNSSILEIITKETSTDMVNYHIIMMMISHGVEMRQPCCGRGNADH